MGGWGASREAARRAGQETLPPPPEAAKTTLLTSTSRSLPPRSSCSSLTRNERDLQAVEKRQSVVLGEPPGSNPAQPPPIPHRRALLQRDTRTHTLGESSAGSLGAPGSPGWPNCKGRHRCAWVGGQLWISRSHQAFPASPPQHKDSLANVCGEALQGDVVQGQMAQAAQLGEALREPAGSAERQGWATHTAGGCPGAWAPLDPKGGPGPPLPGAEAPAQSSGSHAGQTPPENLPLPAEQGARAVPERPPPPPTVPGSAGPPPPPTLCKQRLRPGLHKPTPEWQAGLQEKGKSLPAHLTWTGGSR